MKYLEDQEQVRILPYSIARIELMIFDNWTSWTHLYSCSWGCLSNIHWVRMCHECCFSAVWVVPIAFQISMHELYRCNMRLITLPSMSLFGRGGGVCAIFVEGKAIPHPPHTKARCCSIQGLAGLNWSEVMVANMALEWCVSPQAWQDISILEGPCGCTPDIVSMMLAPRLRSFTICCPKLKLQNFSATSRQALEEKKLDLILMSLKEFAEEDAAWLRILGHTIEKSSGLQGCWVSRY